MTLDASQIEFYREKGYLVLERVIGPDVLAALRGAITTLVEESKTVTASDARFDIGPGHSAATPRVRRIKNPEQVHATFADLVGCREILDPVADLLGGTVRFDHAKLNFKPAGANAAIEWHQDWAFYPHTNDDLLAVGVMIEDCDSENGPLMVLPGSHRGPVYDHHHAGAFVGGIDPAAVADRLPGAVELTAPAGSISIHHVRTLHGSRENRSASTRPLLLFSYAAVDAFPVFAQPDFAEFNSRILRGAATTTPRQVALPIRVPEPRDPAADSIFDNQAEILGRSFGVAEGAVQV